MDDLIDRQLLFVSSFDSWYVDVIAEEKDEQIVEFAMGGICNCCLDKQIMAYLLENDCVEFTVKCLSRCVLH